MVSSREAKQVRVAPSSGVTEREIVKRAVKNIGPDATIYHDDYCTYGILDGSFKHESVNHSTAQGSTSGEMCTRTRSRESSQSSGLGCRRSGGYRRKENAYLYCAHYQHLRSNRGLDRVVDRALSMFCLPQSTVDAYQGSELQLGDEPALLPMAASN